MILFDVNVLIYAHREDQSDHTYYRDRLEGHLQEPKPFGITPLVAAGFLRITTHSKFPNGPTPLPHALAVLESILDLPNAYWVGPGPRHWELLSEIIRTTQSQGKAVADARHAAIAMEQAGIWATRDRDFQRFTSLGLRLEIWEP